MHTGNHPWECLTADIRDSMHLEEVDWIVHLAAQISVPLSVDNPDETLSINVDGTSSIIRAAEAASVKKIIFASSAAIYGDCEEIPIPESAPLTPQSPYAVSKIVGEELIKRSKIQTCSLRFFNVYGPGQSAEGGYAAVIPAFKKAIQLGKECRIFGDGTQIRDFIHVYDLVKIILLSLESSNLPSEMNVASGIGTSLLDLVQLLQELNEYCDGKRKIHIARELTKKFEEHINGDIEKISKFYEQKEIKGEFTIVIEGKDYKKDQFSDLKQLKEELLFLVNGGLSLSNAAKYLAKKNNLTKKIVYNLY